MTWPVVPAAYDRYVGALRAQLFEGAFGSEQHDALAQVFLFLSVFLAYAVRYFMITLCNVALVTGIAARLDDVDPLFTRQPPLSILLSSLMLGRRRCMIALPGPSVCATYTHSLRATGIPSLAMRISSEKGISITSSFHLGSRAKELALR
jgi:hypothetical protein